jgi:SNF2 family DNA or RNA helicase
VFIQPKPPRPEYHKEHPNAHHPHQHAAKDFVKGVTDPFLPKPTSTQADPRYGAPSGTAVPIPRPVNDASFSTTRPWQPQTFGSMGNTYGGFQSVNVPSRPANFVNLTGAGYRDRLAPAEPYSFVDPSKAAADLKALLEGAIEDEDDIPRTRLRKKRISEKADGLVAKLKDLAVTNEAAAATAEEDDDEDEDDSTVEGIKVRLLPHQVEGLSWMRDRELGTRKKGVVPKGGILADDMGLGKTLQSIALILTNPKPKDSDMEDGKRKFPSNMENCTLVVAPLALIRQWELEIKDKVAQSHQLRVCVHHGPQRTKRFQDLKKYDVVITTYQILVSEHGSSSNDADGLKVGCFGLHWYRVILDEAHTIKNRNAKATQACYALRSEYRWCLTGTPMQNNLDELQSLIKFLRIKPYDDLKEWKDQIDRPMKNGRGDLAIKRLQHYLKIFMKRRTKDILKKEGALNPGGKVLATSDASMTGFKVTERKIEKVFAKFSAQERLFYDRLERRADKSLEEMMDGEKVNYASALVLLLRLRQACNHPKLVAGKLGKDGEALGVDAGNAAQTPRKSKVSSADIDEMADMFGGLGVGSKKCDACGNVLNQELAGSGAARCEDCEADLALVEKKKPSKKNSRRHEKPAAAPVRKARNRALVMDSEDEDDGEWIVGKGHRGSTTLGKTGGTDDENAEGEGISIGSDDSDGSDGNGAKYLGPKKKGQKEVITIDDSQASDSDGDSEVEAEYQSSSEEEAELATIITSTKITHLLKILAKEAAQHKFIVFSQFTSMLDLIEPFLKRDGYKYARYDGSMKNDLREASLARLRNDKSCRVLLCSLKCGSLGLNLTAATRVVILEPFWNPVSVLSFMLFIPSSILMTDCCIVRRRTSHRPRPPPHPKDRRHSLQIHNRELRRRAHPPASREEARTGQSGH